MTAVLSTVPSSPSRPDTLPRGLIDVAVIGGGAVGLATAMAMTQAGARSISVVEAEPALASHQTGNNSGVIHSGLYYKPGSLKAKLCCEGRDLMYRFCREHGIEHEACGKIVVATTDQEVPALAELERRGRANGLSELKRLGIGELREHEPHVAGIAGIHVRETGIVNYARVTEAYAEAVRRAGGGVHTDTRVVAVSEKPDGVVVETTRGSIECRVLVNCGGLHSDRIARMCGLRPEVQIVPFRGEYYKLTPDGSRLVRNLIYPVPNPAFPFLGVHYTRMIGGGVEAGPNAVLALSRHGYSWSRVSARDMMETAAFPGFWRMCARHWRDGCGEMYRSLSKAAFHRALCRLIPDIKLEHLEPGGAGVRAQAMQRSGAMVDDFHIQQTRRMVHVLNAPSPAATASIAIGRHIAALVEGHT